MKEEETRKINIVFSGGEMKGGFVGGFLDSFVKEINTDKFVITFYCVSASVPTTLFFLSHGLEVPAKEIWVNALSKEEKNVYNSFLKLDIGGILRVFRDHHLDVAKILNNKHTIIFPLFNIKTKKLELVSNKRERGDIWIGDYDVYEVVHAAIAAPILYGKSVQIGDEHYCDPGIRSSFIFPENKNKTIFVTQNKNIVQSKILYLMILLYAMFSTTLPYFWFSLFVFFQVFTHSV